VIFVNADQIIYICIFISPYGDRNVPDWSHWMNGIPSEKDWLAAVDSFDALRARYEIPHMFG